MKCGYRLLNQEIKRVDATACGRQSVLLGLAVFVLNSR